MAEAPERGSARYYLQRLGTQLEDERRRLDKLDDYRCGNHPLPEGHERMREAYRKLQRKARSNYTGLVVESVRERIKPVGFRTGGKGTQRMDEDARLVWQSNSLDAESGIVHSHALTFGRSYVIVGPPDAMSNGVPVITAEDPRQVTHIADPIRRRHVRAALKMWEDDEDGMYHAVVYLADTIHYFVRPKKKGAYQGKFNHAKWFEDTSEHDDGFADNPLKIVPVVPFVNRPDADPRGAGEFEDVLDIQDRINAVVLDRLVIAKMQAYRQRWMKGVKLTDDDGNPLPPFDPGADLMWAVEDDGAQFGDFNSVDLTPLLKAAESDVNDLAAITRTPPHYLLGALVNLSGDALKAAETGLISKVLDRMVEFGESWELVIRIAGMYEGRTIAADAELIWADPESRSMAELADAALKKQTVGVPWSQLMEDLNYTPTQIQRMRSERAQDALLQVATQPVIPQLQQQAQAPVPVGGTGAVTS